MTEILTMPPKKGGEASTSVNAGINSKNETNRQCVILSEVLMYANEHRHSSTKKACKSNCHVALHWRRL